MSTKLLLIEDVDDLGRSGEIISVKPGFARNYLLPKGVAVLADKRAVRMQARLQEERRKKATIDRKDSEEVAKRIDGNTLSTYVKVDEEGHLYGSVSSMDICKMIEEEYQTELLKKSIQLKHPIKETGIHTITVRLKEDVECSVILKVIPEGGELQEPSEEVPVETEEKKEPEEPKVEE